MKRSTVSVPRIILFVILWQFLPAQVKTPKHQILGPPWKKQAAVFYFYWYDSYSGLHFYNKNGKDSFTDHPPQNHMGSYSYRDIAWHREQLKAMMEAKIDIVLPVYWGNENCLFWSQTGLKKLVKAAQSLYRKDFFPPRIGMFFDTTSLQSQNKGKLPDLTKVTGKKLFYQMISDYYKLIPRKMWACVNKKPLIYLYSSAFVSNYDQESFDFVVRNFKNDFGVKPFIVKEMSWKNIITDGMYSWGASLYGPTIRGRIGNLGPGYNDIACNRPQTRKKDRENGNFYSSGWDIIIGTGASLVTIETWNEWHEGSEIAFSKEYGKKYLNMTAEYIDLWKKTDYGKAPYVWFKPGANPHISGLWPVFNLHNSSWKTKTINNRESFFLPNREESISNGLYLDVNDSFSYAKKEILWITVEYFDWGTNSWFIQYDSAANSRKNTPLISLRNTKKWKSHTLKLTDTYFGGRMASGADLILKIRFDSEPVYFGRIWISKHPPLNQAPSLHRIKDKSLKAGSQIEIPVLLDDPENHIISLSFLRKVPFADIAEKGDGLYTLKLSPSQEDIRPSPYFISIKAKDNGTPSMSDISAFSVSVKK